MLHPIAIDHVDTFEPFHRRRLHTSITLHMAPPPPPPPPTPVPVRPVRREREREREARAWSYEGGHVFPMGWLRVPSRVQPDHFLYVDMGTGKAYDFAADPRQEPTTFAPSWAGYCLCERKPCTCGYAAFEQVHGAAALIIE
jgi:hypothetical protein